MLRHQAALQAVGKTRHHALHVGKLLVEIGAKPRQFLVVAEVGGHNHFVESIGIDLVKIGGSGIGKGQLRLEGFFAVCILVNFLIVRLVIGVNGAGFHFGGFSFAFGFLHVVRGLLFALFFLSLRRFIALTGIILGVVFLVLFSLVGVLTKFVAHVEGGNQVAGELGKALLIGQGRREV